MISSREISLKVLYDVEVNKAYSNIQLKKSLDEVNISQNEKALATELVYGVIKWKLQLDYIIEQFSKIKLHKISPWVINILRLGIYQLKFLTKIPTSAAVNESVKLTKKYGHSGSISYVNGVLRNVSRNLDKIIYPNEKDLVKFYSVKYSYSEELIKKWIDKYGEEFTESLCKANNEIPNICARVNTLRCTKEELREKLKEEGIETAYALYYKDALIIDSGNAANSSAFSDGLFQIQDESSMLVGAVLNPFPGQVVLDVCSAPGGKSTHIAQLMKNDGKIFSRDIHEHKIKLIEDNAERLGIDIIKAEIFDALKLDENLIGKCDRVLVDAPCSGLGIIRRKPDIKWNKNLKDKHKLIEIQRHILNTSSKYVKSGGVLVYSTCTIDDDENIDVINDFLKNNSDFKLDDISGFIPKGLEKDTLKDGYIQTYPNIDRIDGFFIARMIKKN